jgi:hypothetical protein
MNKLPIKKQIAVLQRIEYGTSLRSTAEFEGAARVTVRNLANSGMTVTELEKQKEDVGFIKELKLQARKKALELKQLQDDLRFIQNRIKRTKVYIDTIQTLIAHETIEKPIVKAENKEIAKAPCKKTENTKDDIKQCPTDVLPCGKTKKDCVNCKDIFSDRCNGIKYGN